MGVKSDNRGVKPRFFDGHIILIACIIINEGTIALVSHRVIHKVMICALLGLDNSRFWNIRLDTCGVTTFTHEDKGFVLVHHNDTSFLRTMKTTLSDF